MKKIIKLFSPKFDSKEINASINAIKSSIWASGSGSGRVQQFEKNFKKYIDCDECVAVNNGTAALHLALNVLDIKGKEVIIPSLTFVTTVHSVLYNGGIPIFVDVDPYTLNISTHDLQRKITKKTKVIIPVHFGGFPCNMIEIQKLSDENGIHVVEDAAHACGTVYNERRIGSISELTCFSFHPVKNLAMPKGGAITINMRSKLEIKRKLNSLRWCGIDKRNGPFYDVTSLGFNHYMDEISAAIGIEQLKKVDKFNATRQAIAKKYSSQLNISKKMPNNPDCSYHLFWIRVKERKKFMREMAAKGIETGSHYRPVHSMSYYKNFKTHLPVTEEVGREIVTLPMHPNLSDEDVDFVIKNVNYFV